MYVCLVPKHILIWSMSSEALFRQNLKYPRTCFFSPRSCAEKSFCWSSHETKNGSFIYMSTWDLSTLVVYMLPLSWSLPAFTFHYILKRDFTENGRRTDNGLPFLFPKTKRRIGMVVFALTNKTCTPLLNVVFLLCCHTKSAQLVIMLWTPQSWPLHDTGWCTTSETKDYWTCLVHRAQASKLSNFALAGGVYIVASKVY